METAKKEGVDFGTPANRATKASAAISGARWPQEGPFAQIVSPVISRPPGQPRTLWAHL